MSRLAATSAFEQPSATTLLQPLIADRSGLQFNGHERGDGELILLRHAGKLGFEGVVSKTIDAPFMRRETAAYGAKPNG
jgi:hypothetical protein